MRRSIAIGVVLVVVAALVLLLRHDRNPHWTLRKWGPAGGARGTVKAGDPALYLRIRGVLRDRVLTDSAPFHAPGGTWTILDLGLAHDPDAGFVIALAAKDEFPPRPGEASTHTETLKIRSAVLLVAEDPGAARIVPYLAERLGIEDIAAGWKGARRAVPLRAEMVGSLYGPRSAWASDRESLVGSPNLWLQAEAPGRFAEFRLDFDVEEDYAHLSCRSQEYARDLIGFFAEALRGSGPAAPPPPPPEQVPRVVEWARLGGPGEAVAAFTPDGAAVVVSQVEGDRESTITWVSCAAPAFRPGSYGRVPGRVRQLVPVDPIGNRVLARAERSGWQSDAHLWLLQRQAAPRLLEGPWDGRKWILQARSLSPDQRWLVWKEMDEDRSWILDVTTGQGRSFDGGAQGLRLEGWRSQPAGWQLLLRPGVWTPGSRYELSQWLSLDPATGVVVPIPAPSADWLEPGTVASPDGRQTVELASAQTLSIRDLASGATRSVPFKGAAPREGSLHLLEYTGLAWPLSAWIVLPVQPLTILDLRSGSQFPLGSRKEAETAMVSADLRHVLAFRGHGTYLGRIEIPGG